MGKLFHISLPLFKRILCLFVICFLLIQSSVTALAQSPPENAGSTGWVEISAAVPADFTAPLVVTLMNIESEEEFDFPVVLENNYVTLEELPVGRYSISSGFVEGGDFRYSLVPVTTEYVVEYNEVAASVKIDVIYREEYANGVSLIDDTTDPSESLSGEEVTPDKREETAGDKVQEKEPLTLGKVLIRIGVALAGALIFTGIVFLAVFLVRKNN